MENSMFSIEGPTGGTGTRAKFLPPTSARDVRYSCGYCGYDLNLSSSDRNTSTIGSKYSKSLRRGVLSFLNVDESRFTLVDEIKCIPVPYFSKHSWGLFQQRTKLLCRECGHRIGTAYRQKALSHWLIPNEPISPNCEKVSTLCKYNVKIRALQPSSSEELPVPHFIH